jgi:hypothetical protein
MGFTSVLTVLAIPYDMSRTVQEPNATGKDGHVRRTIRKNKRRNTIQERKNNESAVNYYALALVDYEARQRRGEPFLENQLPGKAAYSLVEKT